MVKAPVAGLGDWVRPPRRALASFMPAFARRTEQVDVCRQGTHLRPGILLDRDGTIIVDHGYVGSVDRVEFIDGAPDAIARFNQAGSRLPW